MPVISIIDAFADLPDPRMDRTKRHLLSDILVLTLCGALCGVDNWVELERFCRVKQKWFGTFLELPLLKQEKAEKVGIKTKRKMCGWDHDYMLTVMGLRRP